jgi:hypothetical protein
MGGRRDISLNDQVAGARAPRAREPDAHRNRRRRVARRLPAVLLRRQNGGFSGFHSLQEFIQSRLAPLLTASRLRIFDAVSGGKPRQKADTAMSVAAQPASQEAGKFIFDPEVFRRGYNREPFQFKHRLADEELLQVEALLRLAQRLPEHQVGWHRADISMGTSFYEAQNLHPSELPLEQALKDIEVSGSYVLIRNPEKDPEYGEFLAPLWDEIEQLSDPLDPGMCYKGCFIFIASPGAVTPFHIDRVMNFHCQIIGRKTIYIWDPEDRTALPQDVLEHCVADPYSGYHPPFEESFKERATACPQAPGIGVHHPWAAPHAVNNGDEVSVSVAITFRSAASVRRAALLRANYSLRKRGMTPTPPGESRIKDFSKLLAFRSLMRLRGTPLSPEG